MVRELVLAIMVIDWNAALELLGAACAGVTAVLASLRGVLAILERVAHSTATPDDDVAIHSVIRVVDAAQWFVGRWVGRLSLIRAKR